MRFHVIALPHTQVTREFSACAFTQKVLRFCEMMKGLGHEVFLYAGERSDAPADVLFTCVSENQRQAIVGSKHYTQPEWGGEAWDRFNQNVVTALHTSLQPHDFICLIGGRAQQAVAAAFPQHLSVEFGVGYAGVFAQYRVFESYAWMHMIYGAQSGGSADRADGRWYDAVIPNQFDDAIFYRDQTIEPGYFLYAGRLIGRKGYTIAQQVCEQLGERLILAGPGEHSGYGEFIGEQRGPELAALMRGAKALFTPTIYVEPFGTVAIEAMACGAPVIATDWGAFTETVEQGRTGFRCRSFSEFADAAKQVDTLDRGYIAKTARDRFSMPVVAQQYERYFERLGQLWDKGWYA